MPTEEEVFGCVNPDDLMTPEDYLEHDINYPEKAKKSGAIVKDQLMSTPEKEIKNKNNLSSPRKFDKKQHTLNVKKKKNKIHKRVSLPSEISGKRSNII
jgi:hypothetical protein